MITTRLTANFFAAIAAIALSSCFMDLHEPDFEVAAEPAAFCNGGDVATRTPLAINPSATGVISTDGSFWAWGDVWGLDSTEGSSVPVRFGKANDWASISVAGGVRIGIKRDGSIWSDFEYSPPRSRRQKPISPVTRECDWARFSASIFHILAIKTDGSLWAWGFNESGNLGDGTTELRAVPIRIGNANNWKEVSATYDSSFAIKTDGTLWGWGRDSLRLFGTGAFDKLALQPRQIGLSTAWDSLALSSLNVAAVQTDGTLWTLKRNSDDGTYSMQPLGVDRDWATVAIAGNQIVGLKKNGTLWTAGDNSYGQLGHTIAPPPMSFDCSVSRADCRPIPAQVGIDSDWIAVAAENSHSAAMRRDGRVFVWGSNQRGQLGNGEAGARARHQDLTRVGIKSDWTTVGVGTRTTFQENTSAGGTRPLYHALALDNSGRLWGWGGNDFGQLGDGTTINRTLPTQVGSNADWTAFSAGPGNSLGLKKDGSLWAWGTNDAGQLGVGDTASHPSPIRVGTENDWSTIVTGTRSSAGIKKTGTLWQWGDVPSAGSYKSTPTQVGTRTDWASVALDSGTTLAIRTDGTLWAWGDNYYGQLGDGTTTHQSEPKQVGENHDWVAVAVGQSQVAALKRDGTLWAWGAIYPTIRNSDGTRTYTLSPVNIEPNTLWSRLLPFGSRGFRAVQRDGTLSEWSNTTGKMSAMNIGTDWAFIDGPGTDFMVGIKTDGSLWTRGENYVGELGLGDSQMEKNVSIPTEVVFP